MGLALSKKQKLALVEQYRELVERSRGMVLTSYAGLSVKETENLRRKIRELGGEFHIVKNTLIARVFDEAGLAFPKGILRGTTAIGFAMEDVPAVAKAIADLASETESVRLKSGMVGGEIYNASQMERLANLPPLPVLRAQLLGLLTTPATRVAGSLAGALRQVASVMNAYATKEDPGAGR